MLRWPLNHVAGWSLQKPLGNRLNRGAGREQLTRQLAPIHATTCSKKVVEEPIEQEIGSIGSIALSGGTLVTITSCVTN